MCSVGISACPRFLLLPSRSPELQSMAIMRRVVRYLLLLWLLVAPIVLAIYADQAGEVDFLLQLVGEPTGQAIAHNDRLFMATARGVLACFHQQTGELVWRALVDHSPLKHFVVVKSSVVVVSHDATRVSAIDTSTGFVVWERQLPPSPDRATATVDISFDSLLNSIRVLAHNSISLLTPEGELMWQFIPDEAYNYDSMKFDKKDAHARHKGELRLLLSSLTLPSTPMPSLPKEAFLSCGCLVGADSDVCIFSVLLSANLHRRSVEINVYPTLNTSPSDLRTNIRSFSTGNFDDTASIFGVSRSGALALEVLSLSDHSIHKYPLSVPNDSRPPPEVFLVESNDDALTLSPAIAYCKETECSIAVPQKSTGELSRLITCQGDEGLTVVGYERSLHHSSLARYIGCVSLRKNTLEYSSGSITSSMSPVVESMAVPVHDEIPLFDMKGLSVHSTGFTLLSSRGQLLFAGERGVLAVREESLAHIHHALFIGPPLQRPVMRRIPSLFDRLSMQHDIFMRGVDELMSSVSDAIEVLASTSPLVVFQRLVRGEYTNRRKTLESKNALFGFNKQAVCITAIHNKLKIVTLDFLQRKVVDHVVPSMPDNLDETVDKVSVLHGDDYDQELIIVMKTASRNLYVWCMSHGMTQNEVRIINPAFVSRSRKFKAVASLRTPSSEGKRQYALVIVHFTIIL